MVFTSPSAHPHRCMFIAEGRKGRKVREGEEDEDLILFPLTRPTHIFKQPRSTLKIYDVALT